MKKILFVISFCIIIPTVGLSTNPLGVMNSKPIFLNLLENEGLDSYHVPTFLVKFALSLSDETKLIKPLFRGAHFINIAICNDERKDYKEMYNRICMGLDSSAYNNLVSIVESSTRISVKALLVNDTIRELAILIHEDDELVAISMTGNIDPHSVIDAITRPNKIKT